MLVWDAARAVFSTHGHYGFAAVALGRGAEPHAQRLSTGAIAARIAACPGCGGAEVQCVSRGRARADHVPRAPSPRCEVEGRTVIFNYFE